MPQEKKQRGRRGETKRKREEANASDHADPVKRHKSSEPGENVQIVTDGQDGHADGQYEAHAPFTHDGPRELPFYGMLDEQEQEYFKQADSTLDLNQFADEEEKDLFLNNLLREAKGKELKIANSQSCSRLMERLIAASNTEQLKTLWGKFSTHFLNLFQHRFASHCCEALFRKAAIVVTLEMRTSNKHSSERDSDKDEQRSMEDLFLSCIGELEGNLGYLITDPFASHPFRVLLVVLSGMLLEDTSTTALLQSKKKEHNVSSRSATTEVISTGSTRVIPDSFHGAIETIFTGVTANLDTSSLRALATHPVANPVLQLLLNLSLTRSSKQTAIKDPRSLFRLFIPDDPPEEGTESVAFINHLLYDPIGSRLLEVIVTHAPGKTFKTLFRSLFKDKMSVMARNETAAFVVIKVLERLGAADLESVVEPICSEVGTLAQRSRTNVVKTLVERCRIRGLDTTSLAVALQAAYGDDPSERLRKMLNIADASAIENNGNMSAERKAQRDTADPSKLNGSLLAQTMLAVPDTLRDLITNSILATEIPTIIAIAEDRTLSRVLQAALTAAPDQDPRFNRLFMPQFYPHIVSMATHTVASHVVDALWEASASLRFIREQMAAELLQGEAALRASVAGRAVWRNWKMDVYKTRRRDWLGDQQLDERLPTSSSPSANAEGMKKKTGIDLARERHAQKQAQARGHRQSKGAGHLTKGPLSGANAAAIVKSVAQATN